MPGGTVNWGPGRLQCEVCNKWFRPAGLSGHQRFYHGRWKTQLRGEILDLVDLVLDRGPLPDDVANVIDYTFGSLNEAELLHCKRRLEWSLARKDS